MQLIFHVALPFAPAQLALEDTMKFPTNWSTSQLNTQVNPTTCLGGTGCSIQPVTAPTLVVTCSIQQPSCILHSSRTGGALHLCTSTG